MFSGNIFYKGDRRAAQAALPEALQIANQVSAAREVGDLDSLVRVYTLEDGTTVEVRDSFTMQSMLITPPGPPKPEAEEEEEEEAWGYLFALVTWLRVPPDTFWAGYSDDQWTKPRVVTGPDNSIYVAMDVSYNAYPHKDHFVVLAHFDSSLELLNIVEYERSRYGWTTSQRDSSLALDLGSGRLYLAEMDGYGDITIVEFGADLSVLNSVRSPANTSFLRPQHMVVDPVSHDLFIAGIDDDNWEGFVLKVDSDLNLAGFKSYANGVSGIQLDGSGGVYISGVRVDSLLVDTYPYVAHLDENLNQIAFTHFKARNLSSNPEISYYDQDYVFDWQNDPVGVAVGTDRVYSVCAATAVGDCLPDRIVVILTTYDLDLNYVEHVAYDTKYILAGHKTIFYGWSDYSGGLLVTSGGVPVITTGGFWIEDGELSGLWPAEFQWEAPAGQTNYFGGTYYSQTASVDDLGVLATETELNFTDAPDGVTSWYQKMMVSVGFNLLDSGFGPQSVPASRSIPKYQLPTLDVTLYDSGVSGMLSGSGAAVSFASYAVPGVGTPEYEQIGPDPFEEVPPDTVTVPCLIPPVVSNTSPSGRFTKIYTGVTECAYGIWGTPLIKYGYGGYLYVLSSIGGSSTLMKLDTNLNVVSAVQWTPGPSYLSGYTYKDMCIDGTTGDVYVVYPYRTPDDCFLVTVLNSAFVITSMYKVYTRLVSDWIPLYPVGMSLDTATPKLFIAYNQQGIVPYGRIRFGTGTKEFVEPVLGVVAHPSDGGCYVLMVGGVTDAPRSPHLVRFDNTMTYVTSSAFGIVGYALTDIGDGLPRYYGPQGIYFDGSTIQVVSTFRKRTDLTGVSGPDFYIVHSSYSLTLSLLGRVSFAFDSEDDAPNGLFIKGFSSAAVIGGTAYSTAAVGGGLATQFGVNARGWTSNGCSAAVGGNAAASDGAGYIYTAGLEDNKIVVFKDQEKLPTYATPTCTVPSLPVASGYGPYADAVKTATLSTPSFVYGGYDPPLDPGAWLIFWETVTDSGSSLSTSQIGPCGFSYP